MIGTLTPPTSTLVGVRSTPPLVPQVGDRWWQSVDDIINEWRSCDDAEPGYWESVLDAKRDDWHYDQIVTSLKYEGWRAFLTCYRNDPSPRLIFGDGHHRLAIAVAAEWPVVPIMFTGDCKVSKDSGDWQLGMPITGVMRW